uniref:Uncharacterized protein n=1 Tax=Hyaloperonospora arabidopsidis (strain Emoy2) TaxID=559515 RepID=M4C1T2_HYAAE
MDIVASNSVCTFEIKGKSRGMMYHKSKSHYQYHKCAKVPKPVQYSTQGRSKHLLIDYLSSLVSLVSSITQLYINSDFNSRSVIIPFIVHVTGCLRYMIVYTR